MKRKAANRFAVYACIAACALVLLAAPVYAAEKQDEETDKLTLVIGGQDTDVDADDSRDAKFEKNSEKASGFVLEYFQFTHDNAKSWWLLQGWDASQLDERFVLNGGIGDKIRLRGEYQSLPYRYGDGATFVLGRQADDAFGVTYRLADSIQQAMQDPDGNATPFFTDATETGIDNALVQMMTTDLLTGFDRFQLQSRRRKGSYGMTFQPTRNWTIDFDLSTEKRDGTQALGSGTYQRITDVDGDGITDYDYFFSIRGIEMPAVIDYRTDEFRVSAGYRQENWFLDLAAGVQEFESRYLAMTYDNPFWFDGVNATSGSRRGLSGEGRVSLEPSNEATDFSISGGFNLPGRTRIRASVALGEHTQDVPILPITTNGATIGTADINRDSVIDALDDPTLTPAAISGLPSLIDGSALLGNSLNASSDTTAINLSITSRPTKKLRLTGRFRSYEYEGSEGIQAIAARTEYIESQVKLDFKGDTILHVPLNFTRDTIDLAAGYKFTRGFRVKAFAKRKSYDYDQYQDTDANTTRDTGSRAVSGTDDDIFGLTASFAAGGWFSGHATIQTAEREFDGTYNIAFSGENTDVRQYDIANRERDAVNLQLDFAPGDKINVGVGYTTSEDEYPDTIYGLQSGDNESLHLSFNYAAADGVNVFVYADQSEWDADMHLRTKCANCVGFGSWDVPNFDWFSDYTDETTAYGAGVSFGKVEGGTFSVTLNRVEGEIEQLTRNPGPPTNMDPGGIAANPRFGQVANVAVGVDFPTQENSLTSAELKYTRKINDRISTGFWYVFEDFELDDFQWDGMRPYGNDYLTVDDPTRFLVLDSRYSDYKAHLLQVFLKIHI